MVSGILDLRAGRMCFNNYFYERIISNQGRKKHYLLQFPLFIISECKMHDLTAFSDFDINILQSKKKIPILYNINNN